MNSMHRTALVLVIVSAFAVVQSARDIDELLCLPECKVEEIRRYIRNCFWDTCTNTEAYTLFKKNMTTTDPNFPKFIYCYVKAWGVVADSDPLDVHYRMYMFEPFISPQNYQVAIKCGRIQDGANHVERYMNVFDCYMNSAENPQLFVEFMKKSGRICANQ